jgi:hypothetical protein
MSKRPNHFRLVTRFLLIGLERRNVPFWRFTGDFHTLNHMAIQKPPTAQAPLRPGRKVKAPYITSNW